MALRPEYERLPANKFSLSEVVSLSLFKPRCNDRAYDSSLATWKLWVSVVRLIITIRTMVYNGEWKFCFSVVSQEYLDPSIGVMRLHYNKLKHSNMDAW